jgi:hypothetical protein
MARGRSERKMVVAPEEGKCPRLGCSGKGSEKEMGFEI